MVLRPAGKMGFGMNEGSQINVRENGTANSRRCPNLGLWKASRTPHPSARVSLANLNEQDYARLGRIIRTIMQEYADEYQRAQAGGS